MKPRAKYLRQFAYFDCTAEEYAATVRAEVAQNAAQLILRRLAHEVSERIRLPI